MLRVASVTWIQSGQPRAYADSIYQFKMLLERDGVPVDLVSRAELEEMAQSVKSFDKDSCFMQRKLDYINKGDLPNEWVVHITYPYAD